MEEQIYTDEELVKIWNNKEKSYVDYWRYEYLNRKEKTRIFNLILKNKHIKELIKK